MWSQKPNASTRAICDQCGKKRTETRTSEAFRVRYEVIMSKFSSALFALFFTGITANAQSVASFSGSYTQNFDGLSSTTLGTDVLPNSGFPYDLAAAPFVSTDMEGWQIRNVAVNALAYRVYGLTGTSAGFVNFGMEVPGDRALGGISNGSSARPEFGVVLQNDTGSTITKATITFEGEHWRSTSSVGVLVFSYQVSMEKKINAAGTFVAPGGAFDVVATSATGSIDGSTTGLIPGLGGTLTDLNWQPGAFLILRWTNSTAGAGLAIDNFRIALPSIPVIDAQPVNRIVDAGDSVTFAVTASGVPAPSYQWQRSGDGQSFTNISNASSAELVLTGVQPSDAGHFRVVVTNSEGSATSEVVTLTVNLPSDIPTAPSAKPALLVTDVSFLANWESAERAFAYTLDVATSADFSEGTVLENYAQRNVGSVLSWQVTGLAAETHYWYRVRAFNSEGAGPFSEVIEVVTASLNTPPTISAIENQVVAAGGNTGPLAFTVGDAETPAADLVVTALSSNTTFVPNNAIVFGGSGANRTVTVTPAANQVGAATITLTVSDGVRIAQTSFVLQVNAAPVITSADSTVFTIGVSSSFTVGATGVPAPTFSATGLPPGVTLNQTTGVLSGTVPAGTAAASVPITITATNTVSSTTQAFTLHLQSIPEAASPIVISTFAGVAGSAGSNDGTGAAARFRFPLGAASDSAGNIYLADADNHVIRRITPAGVVTTVAGRAGISGGVDGPAAEATFNTPSSVAVDSAGNIYVADTLNHAIRKIALNGAVTTIAGKLGEAGSADGNAANSRFFGPQGLAMRPAESALYVADTNNHTIRQVMVTTGNVTTLAGLPGASGSADGTGAAARFNGPTGIALNATGTLRIFVTDTDNNTVRSITSSGVVTTFAGLAGSSGAADGTGTAARFSEPSAVAVVDATVYVLDTGNHTLRAIVASSGAVTTVAGRAAAPGSADGEAAAARFKGPAGAAVSTAGLFIVDTENHTVRLGLLPAAPVIQVQPLGLEPSVGSRVELSVTATGRPAPTYQWEYNNVPIVGATASTLTIPSVKAGDSGSYRVVVSNSMGSVASNSVTLIVKGQGVSPTANGSGGGAPSVLFCVAIMALAISRRAFCSRQSVLGERAY